MCIGLGAKCIMVFEITLQPPLTDVLDAVILLIWSLYFVQHLIEHTETWKCHQPSALTVHKKKHVRTLSKIKTNFQSKYYISGIWSVLEMQFCFKKLQVYQLNCSSVILYRFQPFETTFTHSKIFLNPQWWKPLC